MRYKLITQAHAGFMLIEIQQEDGFPVAKRQTSLHDTATVSRVTKAAAAIVEAANLWAAACENTKATGMCSFIESSGPLGSCED